MRGELPAAAAALRERWAAVVPEPAGQVVAVVGFTRAPARLNVRPKSSAWATKARLGQAHVMAAANASAVRRVVRVRRILPPGAVPVPERADADPAPASAPLGPMRTRETASDGYRRAVAAHQEAARRAGRARPSWTRWSGGTGRCAGSIGGRCRGPTLYRTMRPPRSSSSAPNVAVKPPQPTPRRKAGRGPSMLPGRGRPWTERSAGQRAHHSWGVRDEQSR
ncbi:DciA family protein [Streptomyces sp. GS7]|uniref:DciA family protein n=1 Tax=Streptomyces sp. GS7 TaxID=2692234 RepID=UPI001F1F2F56|nr:DciA family protein [Streptomyces sp. GS7]